MKIKSLEAFKEYVKSDACVKDRQARQLRAKQLKKRGMAALKIVTARGSKCRFFTERKDKKRKSSFLEQWVQAVDKLNRHRSIFSEMDSINKQKVYRALKTNWAKRQIKRA